MNSYQDVYTQIRRIVADHLGLPAVSIRPETSITEELGAGPLDHLELIMTIEEHFDILFREEERRKMITLKDVAENVFNHNQN
jgi:acyl carrier protein